MRKIIRHFEGLSREKILATRPGSWSDYELLGVLQHFQQEDWGRAMAIAELILRSTECSETVAYHELYMDLVGYYRRKDSAAALRWAHAMMAYSEQHEDGLNQMNNWRDLAEVYLVAGGFDTGLRMFTRILRADPRDIWTYNGLGFTLPWAGLYQLAIEVLDKALRLIERSDPEGLKDQLTRQRSAVAEKQAREPDRIDEVDPVVLAEFRDALELAGKRKAGRLTMRQARFGEVEAPPYQSPTTQLLSLGPERDEAVYAEILDQGKVLIPELIWMAFDPELHAKPATDPAHYAPDHAITLLRELREEAELSELAPWLDNADGDWYIELLSEHCGKVGGYTTNRLEALAADTTYQLYVRTSAASALAERSKRVPAERGRIIELMRELLNRSEAYDLPEEETFIGFLIGDILDMDARELYPDIKRAYEEDRVDVKIITLADVHHEWGLEPVSMPKRRSDGLYIRLRCKECGRAREHFVQHVLVDTVTLQQATEGEDVPYDPHIMDRQIVCPKCGAVDRYEMTTEGHLALIPPEGFPAIVSLVVKGESPTDVPRHPRVHYFQSMAFGRLMHPLVALEEYRRRIAEKPLDAKLHLRMGNLLRTLGRHTDALEKYCQAYDLDPKDAEAALNLAMCAHDTGDRETAKAMYERALELSSEKGWFSRLRGSVDDLEAAAIDGLARLKHRRSSPWAAPWEREEAMEVRSGVRPRTQRASGVAKPQPKKRKRQRKRRRRR